VEWVGFYPDELLLAIGRRIFKTVLPASDRRFAIGLGFNKGEGLECRCILPIFGERRMPAMEAIRLGGCCEYDSPYR